MCGVLAFLYGKYFDCMALRFEVCRFHILRDINIHIIASTVLFNSILFRAILYYHHHLHLPQRYMDATSRRHKSSPTNPNLNAVTK